MRFDLTHAAYRVFERAGICVLPDSPSEITAAKLLLALLVEEDCRAAYWLAQEGITVETFSRNFGIELHNKNEFPEEQPQPEEQSEAEPQSQPLAAGIHKPAKKRYSAYSGYHPAEYKSNIQSKARFYLDDQSVQVSRLAKDLESNLEIVAAQCNHYSVRQGHPLEERRSIPLHQGILSIATQDGNFAAAGEPLATEHLLIAAAMDENDIGKYLQENNFEPTALFDRIAKQHQKHSFGYFEVESDNQRPEGFSPLSEDLRLGESRSVPAEFQLHRILDAAANRARESIRVIEDYVRFILNEPKLTQTLKSFRHRLQSIISELPPEQLIAARDTENDIGTSLEAEGEYRRSSPADVLSANFSRLQESLRCLEEFSKVGTSSLSKQLEQLRYESYTLQKSTLFPQSSGCGSELQSGNILRYNRKVAETQLYILLDCRKNEESFTETVNALISGGADVIQLRDKTADDRTLLERGKLLRQLIDSSDENTSDRKPLFIMNDRPDLAVLLNADGVHIGQNELPVSEARKIIGNKLIGISTHSIEQVRQAVLDGADYIGVGPVFSSGTKQFTQKQLVGTELLREVAAERLPIPAFAIGGITLKNIDEVLQTGIKRAAVSSAVLNADDPQYMVKSFTERLHISEPQVQ
ncbi:hypothetical protein FACS189427_08980 [Planctomycetales bacterium]|nr:hypothetical protein FACS189427_08980 [Planctomycetales bacterium]